MVPLSSDEPALRRSEPFAAGASHDAAAPADKAPPVGNAAPADPAPDPALPPDPASAPSGLDDRELSVGPLAATSIFDHSDFTTPDVPQPTGRAYESSDAAAASSGGNPGRKRPRFRGAPPSTSSPHSPTLARVGTDSLAAASLAASDPSSARAQAQNGAPAFLKALRNPIAQASAAGGLLAIMGLVVLIAVLSRPPAATSSGSGDDALASAATNASNAADSPSAAGQDLDAAGQDRGAAETVSPAATSAAGPDASNNSVSGRTPGLPPSSRSTGAAPADDRQDDPPARDPLGTRADDRLADAARPSTRPSTRSSSRAAPAPSRRPGGSSLRAGVGSGPNAIRSGQTNRYTDEHCFELQRQYGVRVPPNATMIEVNGAPLPVTGVNDFGQVRGPFVLLPQGEHVVRFQPGGTLTQVEIGAHFFDEYEAMRQFFGVGSQLRTDWLSDRGAQAYDVHRTPFLLNLQGAGYAAEGQWEAAERKFRRALSTNPSFSPAHLNLAHCLARRGAHAEAMREVQLAGAFNVGNVYGLQAVIVKQDSSGTMQGASGFATTLDVAAYVSAEPLADVDRRMVAFLQGISKYAVERQERVKILNNLAVHFADSRRTELALEYFRDALLVAKSAGAAREPLVRKILSHMETACRDARFAEADEYALMQRTRLP